MKLNKYIDHTLLKRDAISSEIDKLISEAIEYEFKTICIHPIWVEYASKKLKDSTVGITTVIGFPYGSETIETKVFEGIDSLKNGADELDFVISVSMIHERNTEYLKRELKTIRENTKDTTIKLIIETGLLTKEEIIYISKMAITAGWDFLKTSTGIDVEGASVENVKILKEIAGSKEVKASGGIRTIEDAKKMIAAGATRIGTSGGIAIMNGEVSKERY